MSKEGENEIFNRTEVLQEVPSSIVISEDSEGQESMDFSVSLVWVFRIKAVHGSQLKARAFIMKKIKV